MLTIWGRRSAFNVQKVMWFVHELGLPHEHVELGGAAGGLDDPAFLAMNPHGRVPVIRHDTAVVWESHAILRYLAAVFGAPDYWSGEPTARSEQDRWMDWAQTALQPAFLNGVFWGYFRTPEEKRDWPAIRTALADCERHFRLLDRILADRPFLGGESLGLADIPAGTNLFRYFELDIERPDVPNVEAWYRRLAARQAYRDHVMLPFEHLRGKLG